MPTPTYPDGPAPVTLLDRFEKLRREGWPAEEAVECLFTLHIAEHFHTPYGSLSLGFELGPDGKLTAAVDGEPVDPGTIPTRDPDPISDPPPVPLNPRGIAELRARAQERAKTTLKAAMVHAGQPAARAPTTREQRRAKSIEATERRALKTGLEAKATAWLKEKPDLGKNREKYMTACLAKFPGLGVRGFYRARATALGEPDQPKRVRHAARSPARPLVDRSRRPRPKQT